MTDPGSPAPQGRRRRWMLGGAAVAVVLGAGAWLLLRSEPEILRSRGVGAYGFTDPGERVYLGNYRLARRVAVVDSSRVYASIAEYQQIKREGLNPDVPKYHLLMVKASEKFTQAVKAAAGQAGFDVVAETGTVRASNPTSPPPEDLTQATIGALR